MAVSDILKWSRCRYLCILIEGKIMFIHAHITCSTISFIHINLLCFFGNCQLCEKNDVWCFEGWLEIYPCVKGKSICFVGSSGLSWSLVLPLYFHLVVCASFVYMTLPCSTPVYNGLDLYRVTQEERSVFWEVVVLVILSKNYVHVSYSEQFAR
jgi:hypothetical protein